MSRFCGRVLLVLTVMITFGGGAAAADGQMTPQETVASLKVPEGLEVSAWASEPAIINPTNIDIDSRGRVWATEAANYRGSIMRPEGDRIVILEDTDGDGKCDNSKVFAQDKSLHAPLGICVLGNRVYVDQSPSILIYTIDESGDHPAGKPKVFLTGFGGVDHDHGIHAGVFGPDGRYYSNCGNAGGEGFVKNAKGEPVVDTTGSELGLLSKTYRGQPKSKNVIGYQQGLAFRCKLDGSGLETLGHNFRNDFELAVDSFGTVFQCDNDDDGNESARLLYVMEGGNFGYRGPRGTEWQRDADIFPDQSRPEAHWHQRWPGVVPNLLNLGTGAPSGMCIYEGDLLPESYRGQILVADPLPNAIKAYRIEPSGAGYRAEGSDLVRGKDQWFRPSDLCVAPDGSIFIADWYDPGVGGHSTADTRPGQLHGRLYRLAPAGAKPIVPQLDLQSTGGQVAALASPNLATRYLAYNELAHSGENATQALSKVFNGSANPRLRARAFWLLSRNLNGPRFVREGLRDKDANLRVVALRAARLIGMDMPTLASEMLGDNSPFVLRELCLAMNYQPTDKALPLLVRLADRYDGQDRWYLEAFGIGCTGREKEVLATWLKDRANKSKKAADGITWRLKREVPGVDDLPPKHQLVTSWWALAPFDGTAADSMNKDFGVEKSAAKIDLRATAIGLDGKTLKWEKIQTTDGAGGKWVDFYQFCADRGFRTDNVIGYFAACIVSPADQKAKLGFGSDDGIRVWLNGLPILKRDAQREARLGEDVVTVNLHRGNNVLLCKLRNGGGGSGLIAAVAAWPEITFSDDLRSTPPPEPTSTVALNPDQTKNGGKLPPIEQLAAMSGDPRAGAAVFRNTSGANCITCHQIGNEGRMVGPPLNSIGSKLSKAQIYDAILHPSNSILMGYESWVVKTKKGDAESGLLVEETPDHITIKDAAGKYHDIPLDQVAKKVKQTVSLMPEGLANAMTQQNLVNLVEYLASLKEKP